MRENWLNMTFDSTMGNAEGKLSHLTWHLAVQQGIQRANCHTWHDIWQYNGNTEGKLTHLTWHLAVQWGIQRANCHTWHDIWQYNGEYRGQIVTLDMTFGSTMGNTEGKLPHLTWHLAVQRGIQRANCHTWQHVIIILLFNNKNRYDTVFEHYGLIDWFIVFNTTFSNISAISWRPVLVVEEAGVPGENHRPWVSNW